MAFSGWHVETGILFLHLVIHKEVKKENLQVALWCQIKVTCLKYVLSKFFSNILNFYLC